MFNFKRNFTMSLFLKVNKLLVFLSILNNSCFASDEWNEYTLDPEGGEKSFLTMRDQYFTTPLSKNSIKGIFEPSQYQIGSQDYAYATKFYEGDDKVESISTRVSSCDRNESTSSLDKTKVSYLTAPGIDEKDGFENIVSNSVSNLERIDNRKLIEHVHLWPFRVTCHLKIKLKYNSNNNIENCMGTGFLVGPAHILTAAHNYNGWHNSMERASEIEVFPLHDFEEKDQEKSREFLSKINPYTAKVCKVYIKKSYDERAKDDRIPGDIGQDMALFVLDKPIGCSLGWGGMMALNVNFLKNSTVDTHGYPRDKNPQDQDHKYKGRMYGMTAPISDYREDGVIFHKADTTGGQSGSGMWIRDLIPDLSIGHVPPDHYALGIHTAGAGSNQNRGVYLLRKDINFISNIIKSHLEPEHIMHYIDHDTSARERKIDIFMSELHRKIDESESLYFKKQFILYSVAFEKTIDGKLYKEDEINNYCCNIFSNALEKFIRNEDNFKKAYETLSEAMLFFIVRKKIITNHEGLVSPSSLPCRESKKISPFFKKLKDELSKQNSDKINRFKKVEDKYNRINKIYSSELNFLNENIKKIVTNYLNTCPSNLLNLNKDSLDQIFLLMKTLQTCFVYNEIVLQDGLHNIDQKNYKLSD